MYMGWLLCNWASAALVHRDLAYQLMCLGYQYFVEPTTPSISQDLTKNVNKFLFAKIHIIRISIH